MVCTVFHRTLNSTLFIDDYIHHNWTELDCDSKTGFCIQDCWVLWILSIIWYSKDLNVLETGSVSILRWNKAGRSCSMGSIRTRLVLSNGTNRAGVSDPFTQGQKHTISEILCSLEQRTVNRVQKVINPEHYIQSAEPFRIGVQFLVYFSEWGYAQIWTLCLFWLLELIETGMIRFRIQNSGALQCCFFVGAFDTGICHPLS
jgi:hypothetical protein